MGTAIVKHTFQSPIADAPSGPNEVTPTRWNATHTVESVTVDAADISDSTAAGRAILKAADPAAQRTALELGTAATANATAFDLAGTATAEVAGLAGSLGSAAFESAAAFDAAGAAASAYAAAAGLVTALDGSLALIAKSGNAADLSGTLDPARIANGTVPIAKLTPALATVATSGSASDLGAGTLPAARIADASIVLAKHANMATARFVGRTTAAAGVPEELTGTQATAMLDAFTTAAKGLVSAPGSVTGKVLADDGTWVAPSATIADGDKGDITVSGGGTAWAIDNAAVTHAKQSNVATQRIVGRNTAGSGVREEISVSQVLDWIAAANGAIPTRTAGAWAAIANVASDGGDLVFSENASPTTPAADKVKVFAADIASRTMLSFLTSNGIADPFQPFFGSRSIGVVIPVAGGSTPSALGLAATATGTPTSRNPATTNYATHQRRVGYVSATSAGSVASVRHGTAFITRGNGAGLGGFHFSTRWFVSDPVLVTDARTFVGIRASGAAPADVDPSSLVNVVGVGGDPTDTTLQVIHNDGAGVATKVNLGSLFPLNTTIVDVYEVHFYCAPNASAIGYRVVRLNTGDVASGIISTDLPVNTGLMTFNHSRSNNATAAAVGLDVCSIYVETP